MDLAAVFLLSLLGGYYFASSWRLTAFSTRKADGHHLYFRAALYGAIFFVLALLLRTFIFPLVPGYSAWDAFLINYVRPALKEEAGVDAEGQARRAAWLITAACSLFLGPLCGVLLNIFTPRRWALQRSLSGLDRLLLSAQQRDILVQITLNTAKIYIGLLLSRPDPERESDGIRLVPMFSGYRDPQGRMVLTTDYGAAYESLANGAAKDLNLPADWLSQFELAVRAEAIVTATLFSPAVYAQFNPGWRTKLQEAQIAV